MARWSEQLKAVVDALLSKPIRKKDVDVYLLLQLGVFQLMHMRIAPHAAVDNTVKAAGKLGKPWARGLVNAVLRNFQRQESTLLKNLNPEAQLACPGWLLTQLRMDWPEQWQEICAAANQQAPMTLRVNARRYSKKQYAQLLSDNTLKLASDSEFSVKLPDALTLDSASMVDVLPEFNQGAVSVQDSAAQLAAALLQPANKRARLLDACAAPGGKTAHALERHDWSSVVALEIDESRMQRMVDTLARLQLSERATVLTGDARDTKTWWDGEHFDAVLLDAPCSGTGVIRRHPDIKLLRRKSDIAELVKIQQQLLQALWQTVADGGQLLYATCSVLKCENEQQIVTFIENNTDATVVDIDIDFNNHADKLGLQILPGEQGMDGFYYALLEKRS